MLLAVSCQLLASYDELRRHDANPDQAFLGRDREKHERGEI